jgi:hypothetical protein
MHQITSIAKALLVMDQLNIHSAASLYEAFSPQEAKRIAERLEIHQTPKHGSWLNMAEIELSALGRGCLGPRDRPRQGGTNCPASFPPRRRRDVRAAPETAGNLLL